jgi:hypothetical protein
MKTYFINTFNKVSTAGQHMDFISTIKSQEWVVFNDDKNYIEKFLFINDNQLLVSVNGKSSYSQWNYIKVNSSLVIDDDKNRYLLKLVVCNKDIIVLNIDSTDNYSFLINSQSLLLKNPTYEDIQWYLIRQCGIDILSDKQREQLIEEKRIETERKNEEKKVQWKIAKNFIFLWGGIISLFIIGISFIEYKKYHPTIYMTKEENKIAIDLGLSVKWATCNIGANSPEDYGNYYGWGDVTGRIITRIKEPANITDLKFPPRNEATILPSSITNGPFDMAKANWGNNWRLPTRDEAEELLSQCKISNAEIINGKYCFKLTGPNGNHIFLPLADIRFYDGDIMRGSQSAQAIVWTGDLSDVQQYDDKYRKMAYSLNINELGRNGVWDGEVKHKVGVSLRWFGIPVRAVMNK